MAELSKQDIKEIFIEALDPFAQAVQKDFRRIDGRFDKIDGRLNEMDGRFDEMDGRFDKVEGRLTKIEDRLTNVENDVKWMKDNSSALFTKLDKFISLYEKQEQELLMLGAQLKRLEDRVVKLEMGR